MSEPVWVRKAIVLRVHDEQLATHGGAPGIRDDGMLDSALARARNAWGYGQEDAFFLAALYAGGIMQNHPFFDGNKRTGFLAAYIFLDSNGWELVAEEIEVVERCVTLAASEIDEAEFAAWLRENVRAL
jgi:death-on-curing protein